MLRSMINLLLAHSTLLHGGAEQTWGSAWSWAPSVLIGCGLLLAVYFSTAGQRSMGQTVMFVSGVLILCLALISPLDKIGEIYLFSVHMVQHLFLLLFVPPLLILGLPQALGQRIIAPPLLRRIERILRRPVAAWPIAIATIWIWHLPVLYNAALINHNLHILEHLMFLAAAAIFIWPVLTPIKEQRMSPPITLLYITSAGMVNTVLSIILAYIPVVLYSSYLQPSDPLNLLSLFRDQWGITPQLDQQIAGFIMAVPGGLIISVGVLVIMAQWFNQEEKREAQLAAEAEAAEAAAIGEGS